ncbi:MULTISPECIES: hypothetical protein [unclassified Microcoleus]|uniref:hypothetical protein n=1 Tax=unclassified Microcoleus TaxID=2642155 RepID=UPI002FD71DB5
MPNLKVIKYGLAISMNLLHLQANYSSVDFIHEKGEITLPSGNYHYIFTTKNTIARRRPSDFCIGLYCLDGITHGTPTDSDDVVSKPCLNFVKRDATIQERGVSWLYR